MTYKGDSPGKKVTRFRLWNHAAGIMTLIGVPYRSSVVLAGDGGDIAALRGLGFKTSDIWAVDMEQEKLNKCMEKYTGLKCIKGEVGEVSKSIGRESDSSYNSVHLDFCGRFSADNLLSYVDVLENMSYPGFVILTMLKGRETIGDKNSKRRIWGKISRESRRKVIQIYRKINKKSGAKKHNREHTSWKVAEHLLSMRDGTRFNPKKIMGIMEERMRSMYHLKDGLVIHSDSNIPLTDEIIGNQEWIMNRNGSLGPFSKAMIRLDAMRFCGSVLLLARDLDKNKNGLDFVLYTERISRIGSVLTYHSRTKQDYGTPFMSGIIYFGDREFNLCLGKAFSNSYCYAMEHYDAKTSMQQLKSIVLSSPGCEDVMSEIFDISQGTIRAWKAHETMGTYGDLPEPVFKMRSSPVGKAKLNSGKNFLVSQYSEDSGYCGWGSISCEVNTVGDNEHETTEIEVTHACNYGAIRQYENESGGRSMFNYER